MKSITLFPNTSLQPLQILKFKLYLLKFSFNHILLHLYYKLSVLMFASTPFLVQPTNLSLEFRVFSAHMLITTTDPFIILNPIFDSHRNLQNLLQLHRNDIQAFTLSTVNVTDCLENFVFLETSNQLANSSSTFRPHSSTKFNQFQVKKNLFQKIVHKFSFHFLQNDSFKFSSFVIL